MRRALPLLPLALLSAAAVAQSGPLDALRRMVPPEGVRAYGVAAGDLDGDDDLFVAGNDRSLVLHSTARQLAWRSQPRVGALLIDPNALTFAGRGNLDPGDRGAASFPVPAAPAWFGTPLFWQVSYFTASGLLLSNQERTEFLDL